jgi:hypothetical protein
MVCFAMTKQTFRHSGVKSGQETYCTAGTQTATYPTVHTYQPYGKGRFRVTEIYIAGSAHAVHILFVQQETQ